MVDRRVASPRALADSLYIPENDPAYRGYMTGPNDYADLAGAIGQASMVLPPGVGTLFSGGANALRNAAATRAAMAAPERMRMLAAPSTRVAPQDSIAPRLTNEDKNLNLTPESLASWNSPYRLVVDKPSGSSMGQVPYNTNFPPPYKDLNPRNPIIDQTFVPQGQVRTVNEVTGMPSSASRLGSESPQADQALAMAQQRARDAEAKFVSEQQARATGEGMRERPGTDFNMVGSSYDPMGRALQPTYTGTSATAAAAPRSFLNQPGNLPMLSEQGFGAPSVAQNRALALTDRSGGNLVPGAPNYLEGEFSVVHPDLAVSGSSPSAIAGSNMPRLGAAGAPMADVAAGPGAYSAMPMRPIIAGGTVGAAMLANAASQPVGSGRGMINEEPGARMAANAIGSGRGDMLPNAQDRAAALIANAQMDKMAAARDLGNQAPAPMRRPAPEPASPSGGGLASLFNQPLSTRQLFQQSQDNPDDPGAWMRAERQYAATHDKDHPNFDLTKLDPSTGMKRGGTASGKSGKVPDPVHKALEIIHHLLMRQ